jgi:hypothetical protein
MIATTTVEEIRHLLAEGRLSQRGIARELGVSRGTVNAIAMGRRISIGRPSVAEEDFPLPAGLPRRCSGCGGLVQMPCLLCHLRLLRQR